MIRYFEPETFQRPHYVKNSSTTHKYLRVICQYLINGSFNKILCKEYIKLEPKFISRAFAIEVKKRLINKLKVNVRNMDILNIILLNL
jgi:hypothetical protein